MDPLRTSYIVRYCGPALRSSVVVRVLRQLAAPVARATLRVLHIALSAFDDDGRRVLNQEPRLAWSMVAPVFAASRLGRIFSGIWNRLDAAVEGSRIKAAFDEAAARVASLPLSSTIQCGALVVAVAAATHIALLLVVQRYPFPGYTVFVLPVAAGMAAVIAAVLSDDLARAIANRRQP